MSALRLIPRILGVLLLAAAALKAHGAAVTPISAMGVLSAAWLQVALIVAEVLLGLWLITGVAQLGSWALALATFGLFSGVSAYQGWIGASSCGCFGTLTVNPWYTFGFDILVLTALGFGRPDFKPLWEHRFGRIDAALRPGAWALAGVVVLVCGAIGLAHVSFGSIPAAIAYFRGERVSVEGGVVDIGSGASGESREGFVTLTNWTDRPVQVFGGTANCSCTVLGDLPVTIASMTSCKISIRVQLKGTPGVFTRRVSFAIDDNGFKRVEVPVTGQISEAPDQRS